jgi:eukaryotic-like serine/threonine-protein kinase
MFDSDTEPHNNPLVGRILSEKFRVRRVLGQGGMGVVLEVEHVVTQRFGALKLLHASLAGNPEIVERFTREASAAARINSERIVQTFDAGRLNNGDPYIFMELLSGLTLDQLLRKRGPLRFDEAAAIAVQAAEGLAAAHAAGIVHRDIKPANLFLVQGGHSVKLLDFGISKFATQTGVHALTSAGTTLGTPQYMPPEQIVGGYLNERADIYSLGVVLYECVAGIPPYQAESLPALSVLIYQGKYVPVSACRADAPVGFDAIIERCLALEPSSRFASADHLAAALKELFGANTASLMPTVMLSSVPPPAAGRVPSNSASAVRQGPAFDAEPETVRPHSTAELVDVSLQPAAANRKARATKPPVPNKRMTRVLGTVGAGVALTFVAWLLADLSPTGEPMPHPPATLAALPGAPAAAVPAGPNTHGSPQRAPTLNLETQAPLPGASIAKPASKLRSKPPPSRRDTQAVHDGLQERNPYED